MHVGWIVIQLLWIAGALVHGQEKDLKVLDWQPQQVHIAFGGESIVKHKKLPL